MELWKLPNILGKLLCFFSLQSNSSKSWYVDQVINFVILWYADQVIDFFVLVINPVSLSKLHLIAILCQVCVDPNRTGKIPSLIIWVGLHRGPMINDHVANSCNELLLEGYNASSVYYQQKFLELFVLESLRAYVVRYHHQG
ncbi:hypothetical protein DAI22_06g091650 [Oryza sativa Japonica Group]|nr:hypothetical protein DAI22_06g091650 [Oryza sativa Japonica Group]